MGAAGDWLGLNIRTLTGWAIPVSLIGAGAGMLWLYWFDTAAGDFYQRLLTHQVHWVGAHAVLFGSTIALVPAALALHGLVFIKSVKPKGAIAARIGVVLAITGSFFLAGQYAIDFVMPLVAQAGGAAHEVHRNLFTTPWIEIPFYNLTDLTFIGLILLTVAIAMACTVPRPAVVLVLVLWALTIGASAAGFALIGRLSLLALGVALIPFAKSLSNATSD